MSREASGDVYGGSEDWSSESRVDRDRERERLPQVARSRARTELPPACRACGGPTLPFWRDGVELQLDHTECITAARRSSDG